VKRAHASREPGTIRAAAFLVQMTADAERRRRDARQYSRREVDPPHGRTPHRREHPAEGRPGGFPSEGVDADDAADAVRRATGGGKGGRAAGVVEDERHGLETEGVDDGGDGPRGIGKRDRGTRDRRTQADPRRIEDDASEVG
jgi:hypothetical protein